MQDGSDRTCFISIKAELGIVGLTLFTYTNYSLLKSSVGTLPTSYDKALVFFGWAFFVALLFDNYHEQIPIAGLYMIFLGLNSKVDFKENEA